jgi:transposase-like protein
MPGSRKYPTEPRERAVRMVAEVRGEYSSEWAAIESVAAKLGVGSAAAERWWRPFSVWRLLLLEVLEAGPRALSVRAAGTVRGPGRSA